MHADILIVTVTQVEAKAVIQVFQEHCLNEKSTFRRHSIGDRIYHDFGRINSSRVFMVQSGMGAGALGGAQQTVQKGIEALSPSAVIMVGVAFGVDDKKQALGDILISDRLLLYELQRVGTNKAGEPKLIPRGERPNASPRLINLFQSAVLSWDDHRPKPRFGLILSGDKLVDRVDFRSQLRELEPEAIGGEMEGAGIYTACQDNRVDWILVKAICDWGDGNKQQIKPEVQQHAAHSAASFMLHAITQTKISWHPSHVGEQNPSRQLTAVRPTFSITKRPRESGSDDIASPKYVVYIAAPHKNTNANCEIKDRLTQEGFCVKLPFEEVEKRLLREGTDAPEKIREVCIQAIESSDCVVVDLDTYGLDTAWEIGYAEGRGIRIVGFNRDSSLITDERLVNRRSYTHNFMHGWGKQKVFSDFDSAAVVCKNKVVYVCGSFKNPAIGTIAGSPIDHCSKRLIRPQEYLRNQDLMPRDYPLADRSVTNGLLLDSQIVLIALPRYGMDTSWQIGFATANKKQIYGLLLNDDDTRNIERASYWDHWMHGWKSKLRVMNLDDLCAVLYGLSKMKRH